MPRRNCRLKQVGYAHGSGSALLGRRPNEGHSPIFDLTICGEAEPRLTSVGGAVANNSSATAQRSREPRQRNLDSQQVTSQPARIKLKPNSLETTQRGLILQRPFLIDELDLNSRDAVGASVARADGGVGCYFVLFARQTNKPSLVNVQCRE